jgi:hypothetical protein
MKTKATDLDLKEFGAELAHAKDEDQADFFESFCVELKKACVTDYNIGMQMAYIVGNLGGQAQIILKDLGEYAALELKEKKS